MGWSKEERHNHVMGRHVIEYCWSPDARFIRDLELPERSYVFLHQVITAFNRVYEPENGES